MVEQERAGKLGWDRGAPTPYRPSSTGWGAYRPSPGLRDLLEGRHAIQRRAMQLIGETLMDGEPHLWRDVRSRCLKVGPGEVAWEAVKQYPRSWLAWSGLEGQRTVRFTEHAMEIIRAGSDE
jgi:hypothetical protein